MYKSSSSVFHYQLLWVSRLRCCCKRLQRHCCNSACTIFRKDSGSGKQTPLRRFLRHSQKQLFSAQLRLSVNGICISADKRRLYGAWEHNGTTVTVLFKSFQKLRGEAEISLHKLAVVLRPVYSREIENKIALPAKIGEQSLIRINVIFKYFVNRERRTGTVFVIAKIFKCLNKVLPTNPAEPVTSIFIKSCLSEYKITSWIRLIRLWYKRAIKAFPLPAPHLKAPYCLN